MNEFSEVVVLNIVICVDVEGIGFVISINIVKCVASLFVNGEKVLYLFIGICMVDNFIVNLVFGDCVLEFLVGIVIVDVIEKLFVVFAGLVVGDVIIVVNGVVMNGA